MQHIPSKLDHENDFIAGAPALDFANTVGGSREAPSHDHIARYADLVAFARDADLIDVTTAAGLIALAKAEPTSALAVLERAIRLREAIWRVFARNGRVREEDVSVISQEAARALSNRGLAVGRSAVTYVWNDVPARLDRVLWPIAQSAADLLTTKELKDSVRECESETCAWLFLDRTRNHSRRWCDMGDCGNRAKARRFRERRTAYRVGRKRVAE